MIVTINTRSQRMEKEMETIIFKEDLKEVKLS